MSESTIIDTPDELALFRLLAFRGAVKMEIMGMTKRGRPASILAKEQYGLKGRSKKVILEQIEAMIEERKRKD